MKYLLDTCVFSEYGKPRPDTRVLDWVSAAVDEDLYISVLSIGELEKGILRLPGSARKSGLIQFLGDLKLRFAANILDIDLAAMRRWAELMANRESIGRPMPIIDSLIAATALEHDLALVTRNESDFDASGVTILNIWNGT